jgi:hypothetical protein
VFSNPSVAATLFAGEDTETGGIDVDDAEGEVLEGVEFTAATAPLRSQGVGGEGIVVRDEGKSQVGMICPC